MNFKNISVTILALTCTTITLAKIGSWANTTITNYDNKRGHAIAFNTNTGTKKVYVSSGESKQIDLGQINFIEWTQIVPKTEEICYEARGGAEGVVCQNIDTSYVDIFRAPYTAQESKLSIHFDGAGSLIINNEIIKGSALNGFNNNKKVSDFIAQAQR